MASAIVQTVRGGVDSATLGPTLGHEHVFGITPEVDRDFPELSWPNGRDAGIAQAHGVLQALVERGISTVIDCTCINQGRDAAAMVAANDGVDINIVAATGMYTHDFLPHFYNLHPVSTENGVYSDVIVDMYVKDITVGIQGTGVKAGIIKCVTDAVGVTPNVHRLLTAAARAHRETGVPITTHTDVHTHRGLDQQKLFAELGVDLGRVVIGHSGDSDDLDYLTRLMDAGSFIGADRFGYYREGQAKLEQRVETVARLVEKGYASRILLSHDSFFYTDWWDTEGVNFKALPAEWNPFHLSDVAIPALLHAGVSQADLDVMLVDNPRRLLENNQAY